MCHVYLKEAFYSDFRLAVRSAQITTQAQHREMPQEGSLLSLTVHHSGKVFLKANSNTTGGLKERQ